ncbi:MAG: hypothetical protein IKM61_05070 [Eubacteriaceae bacterium]|nr:hypothetical protein [Eubacteriaceae bacterium]
MKTFKKIIAFVLVMAMVASVSVGATIAYLQDTDSDVNVMTLGNVYIEQHEYERVVENGNYKTDTIDNQTSYVLTDFTQAKPLYPAIVPNGGTAIGITWDYDDIPVRMSQVDSHGGASVFNTPNAVDKFVTVENTGKSDAYVRTIIALEVGTAEIVSAEYPNQNLIMTEMRATEADKNIDGKQPWTKGFVDYVEIDGNKYHVYELIYTGANTSSGWKHENGILPAGATTYPNLCQVYMASRATNEDVEAIDGNKNGTYDILVLSQAVQTNGFADAEKALDTAFGDVTAEKAAEWFGGMSIPTAPFVSSVDEITEALKTSDSVTVSLAKDLELTEVFEIPAGKEVTIDLAGNEISLVSTEAKASSAITNKGTLTLKNGTVTYEGVGDPSFGYGTNTINNTGKLVIDGATIINTTDSGSSVAIDCSAGAELIVNSGEIVSQKNAIRLCPFGAGAINCTINGGTITGSRAIQIQLPSNKPADAPEINLTINGGKLNSTTGLAVYSYSAGQSFANVDVTITGGTFNGDVCFGGGNAKTTQENVSVTGGTFNGELGRYLANDGWEDIAKP